MGSTAFRRTIMVLVLVNVMFGCVWLGGHPQYLPAGVRHLFVDTSSSMYEHGREIIATRYWRQVDRETLDRRALAAISDLDRFSRYLPPDDLRELRMRRRAAFGGIGITVNITGRRIIVRDVTRPSPAAQAGIRKGDRIVAVDGTAASAETPPQTLERIRGEVGTDVKVTVVRDGRRRTLTLTRAELTLPVAESQIISRGRSRTVLMRLSSFTAGSAAEARTLIEDGLRSGADRVIVDLRGNGGGLVREAADLASVFLPDGSKVVSLRGRGIHSDVYRTSGTPIPSSIPVAVLTDRRTASASEILAGALQDTGRAVLVGERTYGKGVFQQVFSLPSGGGIELTVGSYFTPKGRNLGHGTRRGAGLSPDVRAPDRPRTAADETLEAALRALSR